jgi:hypothetical protein
VQADGALLRRVNQFYALCDPPRDEDITEVFDAVAAGVMHIPEMQGAGMQRAGPSDARDDDDGDEDDDDAADAEEEEQLREREVAEAAPVAFGAVETGIDAAVDVNRAAKVFAQKIKQAEGEADKLRRRLEADQDGDDPDAEAFVEFAEERVRSAVAGAVEELAPLRNIDAKLQQDAAAAEIRVGRGEQPRSGYDPGTFAGHWPYLWYYGDGLPYESARGLLAEEYFAHTFGREALEYGSKASCEEPWEFEAWDPGGPEYKPALGVSGPAEWRERNDYAAEVGPTRWQQDIELMITLQDLLQRTKASRTIRATVGGRGFARRAKNAAKLSSADCAKAMLAVGKMGSVSQVMRSRDAPSTLKAALSTLRMATARIAGTEGSRAFCGTTLLSRRIRSGANAVFCTPNYSDSRAPLFNMLFEGPGSSVRFDVPAPTLPNLAEMRRRVATHPVAHAKSAASVACL